MVTLNSAIAYQLDLVNKGKRPMGMSSREVGHMLHEFLVAMAHLRDNYVDERCPK